MSTLHGQIMNDSLPQLPAPDVVALSDYFDAAGQRHSLAFTADQLHAYALAAIAQADAQIEALTAQRDELLAALEGILMHIGTGREDGVEWVCEPVHRDEIKAARAAIAKCKEAA